METEYNENKLLHQRTRTVFVECVLSHKSGSGVWSSEISENFAFKSLPSGVMTYEAKSWPLLVCTVVLWNWRRLACRGTAGVQGFTAGTKASAGPQCKISDFPVALSNWLHQFPSTSPHAAQCQWKRFDLRQKLLFWVNTRLTSTITVNINTSLCLVWVTSDLLLKWSDRGLHPLAHPVGSRPCATVLSLHLKCRLWWSHSGARVHQTLKHSVTRQQISITRQESLHWRTNDGHCGTPTLAYVVIIILLCCLHEKGYTRCLKYLQSCACI